MAALHERYSDLDLHLTGALQSNKVKERLLYSTRSIRWTARRCARLGQEIDRQKRQPALFVEINTAGEPQKSGAAAGCRHVPAQLP